MLAEMLTATIGAQHVVDVVRRAELNRSPWMAGRCHFPAGFGVIRTPRPPRPPWHSSPPATGFAAAIHGLQEVQAGSLSTRRGAAFIGGQGGAPAGYGTSHCSSTSMTTSPCVPMYCRGDRRRHRFVSCLLPWSPPPGFTEHRDDPLRAIGEICRRHGAWFHIDASYAGTAAILPEKRWIIDGVELADSFVFNPHKWMLVNFDCSAYFVKDVDALLRTFSASPEYLRTAHDAESPISGTGASSRPPVSTEALVGNQSYGVEESGDHPPALRLGQQVAG
jgi:hypothetical protein